jgi:hypothetical protein
MLAANNCRILASRIGRLNPSGQTRPSVPIAGSVAWDPLEWTGRQVRAPHP